MTLKTWRTWSAKERSLAKELRYQGLTAAAIAERLRRTLASVKCRLQQDGGGTRRYDVLAHDDTGDTITVQGPNCPECGCPMQFIEDPADK